jgi:hypothetical protein
VSEFDERGDLLREAKRFLVALQHAESEPQIWERVTRGTGIATTNGLKRAIENLEDVIGDSVGTLPRIDSPEQALREIVHVASDKRGHVTYKDHCNWLEVKMGVIVTFAKEGLAQPPATQEQAK